MWSARVEKGRIRRFARQEAWVDRGGIVAATGASTDDGRADEFAIDEERPRAGTVVLAIHGDADIRAAGELRDRLGDAIEGSPSAIVLDLTDATFLDSMTLGVFLTAMKRLRARGGRFRVVAPRAEIRRIFEMTLLDRVFDLDVTRQEALAATGDGRKTAAA
jgi:anti-sigma B factor antagonist